MHCTFSAQPCKMVSSNDVHCSNVEVRCVSNANLSSHKSFDLEQKIEQKIMSLIFLENIKKVDI